MVLGHVKTACILGLCQVVYLQKTCQVGGKVCKVHQRKGGSMVPCCVHHTPVSGLAPFSCNGIVPPGNPNTCQTVLNPILCHNEVANARNATACCYVIWKDAGTTSCIGCTKKQ